MTIFHSLKSIALSHSGRTLLASWRYSPTASSRFTPSIACFSLSASRGALHEQRQRITLIPGDGIGPEVMAQCKRVLDKMALPIGYDEFTFSYQQASEDNDDPADILKSIKKNRLSLVGHITPAKDVYLGTSLGIISTLDFFANVTYIKNLPGINTRHAGVDIILVREQSEGEYKRMEHAVFSEKSGEAVEALKIITYNASYRIVKFAFDQAIKHNRKKVTLVHKANIMKKGDGMFLSTGKKVAKLYPDIQFEDMIVDNMCMQSVWKPQQFDVIGETKAEVVYGRAVVPLVFARSGLSVCLDGMLRLNKRPIFSR